MRIKSGAGASVSSGAAFQARVGACLISNALCNLRDPLLGNEYLSEISFETTEHVDDINVTTQSGTKVLIQAKSKISYTLKRNSEFLSVIIQFTRQSIDENSRMLLVTSGRSSKKITFELRNALDLFRTSSTNNFFSNQPQNYIKIITDLLSTIKDINHHDENYGIEDAQKLLRRVWVETVDIEKSSSLERAIVLALGAKECFSPEIVWGKIISDCLDYSKNRQSLSRNSIIQKYNFFFNGKEAYNIDNSNTFFDIEINDVKFRSGKEIFLCDIPNGVEPFKAGKAIFEIYRFDENCNERVRFTEKTVVFDNILEFPLLARAATYEGLYRRIEQAPELIDGKEITFYPMNSEKNFDDSPCARIQSEKLTQALRSNPKPLKCVTCGKAVSTTDNTVIERGTLADPCVGICHNECLQPSFRILGTMKNRFFANHPELVNFDIEEWYRAADGGQGFLRVMDSYRGEFLPVVVWSGNVHSGPDGDHIVELSLSDGSLEYVTERNRIQRFSAIAAHKLASQLMLSIEDARSARDPYCVSSKSKIFAQKSQLLSSLPAPEKLSPVCKVQVSKYDDRLSSNYSQGYWYAPLLYLKSIETGEVINFSGRIFLISDPLKLHALLSNWQEVGLVAKEYEVPALTTDRQFDDFMLWCVKNASQVFVDPLFDPASHKIVSGTQIRPMPQS